MIKYFKNYIKVFKHAKCCTIEKNNLQRLILSKDVHGKCIMPIPSINFMSKDLFCVYNNILKQFHPKNIFCFFNVKFFKKLF